jgi:cytochrome P450
VTFYLAGSETTLAFTRMMIYRLASYPEVMSKVQEEFEREANTEAITLAQLKNLKYFEKVQKEVLRMDSSIGAIFTRLAQKDHYLGNLQIRKGMAVNVRFRATHYKQSEYLNPL